LSPARKPRVVDALAGALTSERAGGGSFLDIGAGLGYFSLAAAARGHSVIAFEMSEGSLELFLQSIAHNGYQDKIILHRVPLGAAHGDICVDRSHGLEGLQASRIAEGYASALAHSMQEGGCTANATRQRLDDVLSSSEARRIGVVRIAAYGWEG